MMQKYSELGYAVERELSTDDKDFNEMLMKKYK